MTSSARVPVWLKDGPRNGSVFVRLAVFALKSSTQARRELIVQFSAWAQRIIRRILTGLTALNAGKNLSRLNIVSRRAAASFAQILAGLHISRLAGGKLIAKLAEIRLRFKAFAIRPAIAPILAG
jgi:hypothetical protein